MTEIELRLNFAAFLLRDAGAKEIHMRVTAPPVLHPCYYGTDIDSRESLIACHHSVPEICRIIGADSLGYLPVDKLQFLAGHENYCSACFSGKYPTPVPQGNCKRKFEQRLAR
jgi:amidophosphoribosyltransferase